MSQFVLVSGPIARIPSKGMAGLQLTLVRVVLSFPSEPWVPAKDPSCFPYPD